MVHYWSKHLATRAHTVPRFYLKGFVSENVRSGEVPYLWVGSIADGKIVRKAPKNVSVLTGYYDGQGALAQPDAQLEKYLAAIESDAAKAIDEFVQRRSNASSSMPPEIARFLAWQAARTPGWIDLVQGWANEPSRTTDAIVVELPPFGFENIKDSTRLATLVNPETGDHRSVDFEQICSFMERGYRWEFSKQDSLELMHIQAWYFQVRHFPRLMWTRLTAPDEDRFITSDRAVSWLADGYADTPPAALRHQTAEVVAPLTKNVALVGRNTVANTGITARDFNLRVAMCASTWIAGPTREVVQIALLDREEHQVRSRFH